jgi:hypothetical protein
MGEVLREQVPQGVRGIDLDVIALVGFTPRSQFLQEGLQGAQVSRSNLLGLGEVLFGVFHAVEADRAVEGKV